MSSNFIYQLRRYSGDPLAVRLKHIGETLAAFEAQQVQIEASDILNSIRSDNSVDQYKELSFTKVKPVNTTFYLPFEPDLNLLKCWFKFDSWGKTTRDASFSGNPGVILGQTPTAATGPDKGYGAGTIALSLDGLTQSIEVLDNPSIQKLGLSVGFSVAALVYPTTFAPTASGAPRVIAEKIDGPSDMWSIFIDSSGFVHAWHFTGGANGSSVTTVTPLVLNTWNWIVVTYNAAGGSHLTYINGLDMNANGKLVAEMPGESSFPNAKTNLYLGSNAANDGFFQGAISDFRFYKEKVLSQTEVTNLNTNMITTSSIAFGSVAIVGMSLISA